MESIGKRIKRLRTPTGWSRAELGRRMQQAIGRGKPFSGELIRLYEEDVNAPGPDARLALAKVFEKSEPYIEFGIEAGPAAMHGAPIDQDQLVLLEHYRRASPAWKSAISTLALLAAEQRIEAPEDVNQLVTAAMKPHRYRPAIPSHRLAVVRERTGKYGSGRQEKSKDRRVKKP